MNDKQIQHIAKLISGYWKILQSYDKLISESPPQNHNRLKSNHRNAERNLHIFLEDFDMKIICYDGQQFTPNLAVSPINADEFNSDENLIIEQTISPTILVGGKVIITGKVTLTQRKITCT